MTLTAALAIVLEDGEGSDLTPQEQQRQWAEKARGKAFAAFDRVREPRNLSRARLAACDVADVTGWIKRDNPRLVVNESTVRAHLIEYVLSEAAEPVLCPTASAIPGPAARPWAASRILDRHHGQSSRPASRAARLYSLLHCSQYS